MDHFHRPVSSPQSGRNCALVGGSSLLIRCAALLLQQGYAICCVVSEDEMVTRWAAQEGIACNGEVSLLEDHSFEYLFSIINDLILPPRILDLPRRCAINFHDAPLPRYAGMYAATWAIKNREVTHGVTWHLMAERLDAGDILRQRLVDVAPDDTTVTLGAACYEAAFDAFTDLLSDLESGQLMPRAQDLRQRTYFGRYTRPAVAGVFSPTWVARNISAHVRALTFGPLANPLGLAKLHVDGEFVVVNRADVLPGMARAQPGTITGIDRDTIRVATPDGEIALGALSTIDGAALPIHDAVDRFRLHVGYRFIDLDPEVARRITAANAALCRHEEAWVQRLQDVRPLQLPYAAPPAPPSSPAVRLHIPLPRDLTEDVTTRVVGTAAATGYLAIIAAFGAYLARITGVATFDIGIADATAQHLCEGLGALYAEYTPLRMDIDADQAIAASLGRIQAGIDAGRRQLTYGRDSVARYPILRATVAREGKLALSAAVQIVPDLAIPPEHSTAAWSLIVAEGSAEAYCSFDTGGVDPEDARRITDQFAVFLRGIVANPDRRVADLPLLSTEERRKILAEWNDTRADYPAGHCVHELVEAQAEQAPDAVAVICGDEQLTYRELDRRANRLAHHLRSLGVGPETPVGLCMERSLSLIVGLLGVLKAGGGYVPLDPTYPAERLSFLIEDAQIRILLTQQHMGSRLPPHVERVVLEDGGLLAGAHQHTVSPPGGATSRSMAYIIYTSGSTGQPKGVVVEHRSLRNYVLVAKEEFAITPHDRTLQFASLSFDAAAEEIFPTLAGGATLVLRPPGMIDALPIFLERCDSLGLTILDLPTAFWHELVAHLAQTGGTLPTKVRLVIIGGEAVLPARLRQWRQQVPPCVRLLNTYGPTEATVVATMCDLGGATADSEAREPAAAIGRPIRNVQAYVLDARLQPLPVGVPGELYIGGAGLARGYLGQPGRTAEWFIPDPFAAQAGERLYRTGDRARYRPDGQLVFLGRSDGQVKIRGMRVEPGEVEAALLAHADVRDVVVMAREERPGEVRLVAYVVPAPDHAPDPAALAAALALILPAHMVPSAYVLLDALPLTPSGKIDRRALPTPGLGDLAVPESDRVAPRDALERQIAQVWEELLGVEGIAIHDGFFDLGGHSLLALTMIDRLAALCGKRISVAALFGAGTIAALAERFRQAGRDESRLVRMREGGAQTAIFCIHTWFNDGDLLAYRPLLAYLPPDRPVYGLLPRLTVAGEFERTRVEDLAADCLQQIQELQPHGPYVLCGNSSGGVIAYELAHQLQSLGERVALLALFDSSAPGSPPARPPMEGLGALGRGRYQAGRARAKLLHHVHLVFRLPPREKIRYVRSGSARRRHTAARNRDPQTQRLREASMEPYSPHHPYSGRTLLFWGRYSEAGAPGQPDPRHGWSRLVRDGLEIYRVPSDHFSLLREPLLLREVARVLRARLASAERDVQGPS